MYKFMHVYIYIHLISFVTLENPEFSIEQNFITHRYHVFYSLFIS